MSLEEQLKTRKESEYHVVQRALSDPAFKSNLLRRPRAAIKEELGITLPQDIDIRVIEEKDNELYVVLPVSGDAVSLTNDELSENDLDHVAGGTTCLEDAW